MERKQAGTLDMTEGSPARVLLLFAVPVILSNLFQQLYNLVDSLIVGNYLGPNALWARRERSLLWSSSWRPDYRWGHPW